MRDAEMQSAARLRIILLCIIQLPSTYHSSTMYHSSMYHLNDTSVYHSSLFWWLDRRPISCGVSSDASSSMHGWTGGPSGSGVPLLFSVLHFFVRLISLF